MWMCAYVCVYMHMRRLLTHWGCAQQAAAAIPCVTLDAMTGRLNHPFGAMWPTDLYPAIHVCMSVCVYVCMSVCVFITTGSMSTTNLCPAIHVSVYVCTCVCTLRGGDNNGLKPCNPYIIYIYIYIYIYTYIHKQHSHT